LAADKYSRHIQNRKALARQKGCLADIIMASRFKNNSIMSFG